MSLFTEKLRKIKKFLKKLSDGEEVSEEELLKFVLMLLAVFQALADLDELIDSEDEKEI